MINQELHKQPELLDRNKHRGLRLRTDASPVAAAAQMNAIFLTIAEFGDACKDYPILFLPAGNGENGKPLVAPVAVMGLKPAENLFVETGADGATVWTGRYVPAMLRAYPFTMVQTGEEQWSVCIDRAWSGLSETDGERLFDDQGQATPFMTELQGFVERLEAEVIRTRSAGERLLELGLLQEKRFDATLPDGTPLSVDGFMAVNDKRLAELSDAEIIELHKTGLMGVLVTHQVSLGNMRALVERRLSKS